MRRLLAVAALLLTASCGRTDVTQPTPVAGAPTSAGSAMSLSLDGWVGDTASRPLEGARVEVLSGPHAGAVAITEGNGNFAFGQTFSAVPSLRATKDGYVPAASNVFVPPGTSNIRGWFRLGSPNDASDLSGSYTLTFTADPACQSLPREARARTYGATLTFSAPAIVTLSGGRFVSGGYPSNLVYLSTFENFVRLDFSDPPIWERLADPTSVYISGEASGTVHGTVSELSVSGEFEYCGVTSGAECEEEVACESHNHRLVLTRQ